MGRSVRLAFVPAAVALAAALAACGGSGGSSSGTSSSASGAAATSDATNLAGATATYQPYVGGSSGKADTSKTAVTIGFVNNDGGVPSFPEADVGAQAAVRFLNENLGGINGAPVKLDVCNVGGSEEQGQSCAQQFLGNSQVNAITQGSLPVGAQTFHKTVAGKKPVIIGSPNSVADASAKNAYPITAGVFGTDPGFVYYATRVLHAKTAALLFPGDDPTGQVAANQIKTDLTKAGVKVTAAGYKSTSPDLLPVVQASGAPRADVTIALTPSPPTCIAGAKALQQAGVTKPILGLNLCVAGPVKQAVGDYPKWTYISVTELPVRGQSKAVDGFLDVMNAYAGPNANTGGFAQHGFMSVLTAAKMIMQAGGPDATAAQISAKLKAFTGPGPMLAPALKWGIVPPLPALGTVQSRLYTYQGDDKWKDATNGQWVPTAS